MQAASEDVNGAAPQKSGRKARWAKHREQRREELIQAAIEAVLHYGPEVDMDQEPEEFTEDDFLALAIFRSVAEGRS